MINQRLGLVKKITIIIDSINYAYIKLVASLFHEKNMKFVFKFAWQGII